jgi:hypothetical protein
VVPREDDQAVRRSVVPEAAGRSLWLAALWTGVGAAVVSATVAIVAVAVLWLPVSGQSNGRTGSAIHAGLLTFLASVHGGITVDAVSSHWLPLGMLIAVGITAWRAGSGLADAAADLEERDPGRLAAAGAMQAVSFVIAVLVAVPFSRLGSSSAPLLGVGFSALLLFVVTGGVSFVRSSELRVLWTAVLSPLVRQSLRGAAVVLTVYLGSGAVLVAGSLVVHHGQVEALSRQVGGGFGGIPILLLGVLTAPNAAICAASYLAGPGFALGTGTSVSLTGTAHGTLPAFPVLAAVPSGHGTGPLVLVMAALTVILAGVLLARSTAPAGQLIARVRVLGAAAGCSTVAMVVLGWQAGGSVGSARLRTVGPSPWRLGLAVGLETALAGGVALALGALIRTARSAPQRRNDPLPRPALPSLRAVDAIAEQRPESSAEDGQLAG